MIDGMEEARKKKARCAEKGRIRFLQQPHVIKFELFRLHKGLNAQSIHV